MLATKFAYSVMINFGIKPDFIESEQEFYDMWVPAFFILSFLVSLPKKLTALKYMSLVTAFTNIGLGIVVFS